MKSLIARNYILQFNVKKAGSMKIIIISVINIIVKHENMKYYNFSLFFF